MPSKLIPEMSSVRRAMVAYETDYIPLGDSPDSVYRDSPFTARHVDRNYNRRYTSDLGELPGRVR
jgi:hypothetical protein